MPRERDRMMAIALSVLVHVALIAALAYGWWLFRRPQRAAPALAIEGTVVDARSVPGLSKPVPAPPPPAPPPAAAPPPEELGPPPPSAEELAQREQEQKQAAERAAAEQAQAAQRAAEEKAAADKAAADQAAADKAAQEKAAVAAKAAEQKRKAEEAAAAAAAAAEAQEQSEREADLQRSLAEESRTDSAASNAALASWRSQITAKITRAWLRPPTARAGLECDLYVTQVPGGDVTQVKLGQCNGDQAVRDSIEAAVYRASPLPPPPDPALFDRSLKITFKPDLN
jgi:colicin import membrane protein